MTIDSVPEEEDVLIMVGDWNARVGNTERSDTDSEWEGVQGCHGVGKMNESGERFLSFCAMNSLSILNTYFQKNIHKLTWQHPGNKQWHCIDYILMRQSRSATCAMMPMCCGQLSFGQITSFLDEAQTLPSIKETSD